ncbi:hypothetical protein BH11ACT2_BH11ACT2_06170 [soil metagenome]
MSADEIAPDDAMSFEFPEDARSTLDEAIGAFESLETQNARVTARVASALNIGTTDVRALLFIAQNAPVTPTSTATFLGMSTGATTSLMDRMAGAGLISRSPHPNDRRSLLLELAPAGRDAVLRVQNFYRRAFHSVLPAGELAALAENFRNIARALSDAVDVEAARAERTRLGADESR